MCGGNGDDPMVMLVVIVGVTKEEMVCSTG